MILNEIVKRMGKKKAALILAAMDAKKVKDLCQTLAKESQTLAKESQTLTKESQNIS